MLRANGMIVFERLRDALRSRGNQMNVRLKSKNWIDLVFHVAVLHIFDITSFQPAQSITFHRQT